MKKPYGLRRIFSGPVLGTLLALGLVGTIVTITIVKLVLVIWTDVAHS